MSGATHSSDDETELTDPVVAHDAAAESALALQFLLDPFARSHAGFEAFVARHFALASADERAKFVRFVLVLRAALEALATFEFNRRAVERCLKHALHAHAHWPWTSDEYAAVRAAKYTNAAYEPGAVPHTHLSSVASALAGGEASIDDWQHALREMRFVRVELRAKRQALREQLAALPAAGTGGSDVSPRRHTSGSHSTRRRSRSLGRRR